MHIYKNTYINMLRRNKKKQEKDTHMIWFPKGEKGRESKKDRESKRARERMRLRYKKCLHSYRACIFMLDKKMYTKNQETLPKASKINSLHTKCISDLEWSN